MTILVWCLPDPSSSFLFSCQTPAFSGFVGAMVSILLVMAYIFVTFFPLAMELLAQPT